MKKHIATGLAVLAWVTLALAEDKPLPGDFQHQPVNTQAPAAVKKAAPAEVVSSKTARDKPVASKSGKKSRAGKAATRQKKAAYQTGKTLKNKADKAIRGKAKKTRSRKK